jgi:hypothetical protein
MIVFRNDKASKRKCSWNAIVVGIVANPIS